MILINNRLPVTASLLITLLFNASFSLGQPRRLSPKKAKPMLTLTHPVSGIKVVFDDPAFIGEPLDYSAWKKLSIYLPGQAKPLILETDEDSGYMVNDNEEEQWSPDGTYMTVWDTYSIINKDEFSGQRIAFISLKDATEVRFYSKKGSGVSTDNFRGWVKNKPHVALKAAQVPGPKEVLEEAQDIW